MIMFVIDINISLFYFSFPFEYQNSSDEFGVPMATDE